MRFLPTRRTLAAAALAASFFCGQAGAQAANDYPTEAIADYVYGCLKANGETREVLAACSCSIDIVASIIPYPRYEEASTFLSMMQVTGEAGQLFRDTAESKAAVDDLRRAQAEGEIRCFKAS